MKAQKPRMLIGYRKKMMFARTKGLDVSWVFDVQRNQLEDFLKLARFTRAFSLLARGCGRIRFNGAPHSLFATVASTHFE